jgi:hypothetical protein
VQLTNEESLSPVPRRHFEYDETAGNLKIKASYKPTKTALLQELMNLSRYQLRIQRGFFFFFEGGRRSK